MVSLSAKTPKIRRARTVNNGRMDPESAKQITKMLWSVGDYTEVAKLTMPPAVDLVDAVGIAEGQTVLDIATGSGNVAVLAAQRGAIVGACDLTPSMVELARSRAKHEGLEIDVIEGDAEALPYPDDTFDVVLSVFGAMFAPRPEIAAAEMFRVAKRDGVVGMANWTPKGFSGRQIGLLSSYAPGGAASESGAMAWGTEEAIAERLGPHAGSIETARLFSRVERDSWEAAQAHAESNSGPVVMMKQMLDDETYAKMIGGLRELFAEFNQATDGRMVIDSEYLRVIARKRA